MYLLNAALCFLLVGFGLTYGSDFLYVQHVPNYCQVDTNSNSGTPLKSSQFSDIVSAVFGFSSPKDFRWDGIKCDTIFERPKAAIVMEFNGLENIKTDVASNKFPLLVDEEPFSAYFVVSKRINDRYPEDQSLIMDVANDDDFYPQVIDYPEILNDVDSDPEKLKQKLQSTNSVITGKTLKSLNLTQTPDSNMLAELQFFNDVLNALIANEDRVSHFTGRDLIWFQSFALKALKDAYGTDSAQVTEALAFIRSAIKQFDNGLQKIYGDNYFLTVLTVEFHNEIPKHRLGRSLLDDAAASSSNSSTWNLSPTYDEDYPAMFNIIFFVSLLLSLTVFAIALGMWYIDPGRDSIIYRMTSQRMKKDQ